jgi:site-specific DNA-methyltransferase (adenine-specific)
MSLLFNEDCLEQMKNLEDKSVDLIFCDLPYGQTSCKWDCKIDLEQFWKQVIRIKKLNTPIFFTTTTKFGVSLINSAPKKCFFRYDIVWVKSAPAGFLSAKKMPMRKHEMIYVFYEKLPFYDLSSHSHKFIKETVKEPESVSVIKEEPELDEKYKNKGGLYSKVSRNGLLKAEPHYDPPLPTTMLEVKSTRGKHSTEKPVALMEWILKYYSKEGDVVLDPTMGSGSTGVACKNMNRNFIGIEKDPEIYEVAVNRIED